MIFSDHFIHNNTPYKLIGRVNNNIIIWTIKNRSTSEILVYNTDLHLIRSVSSGILKPEIDASPEYFNLTDSFAVAYQYKLRNMWQYRLTFFDDNGTQLSTIIVDSLNSDKAKAKDGNYFYKVLLSQDKKTICYCKLSINTDNSIVKTSCTFLKNNEVSHEQFFLPFDFLHESIEDFLIDSNRNFVVLETTTTDSSFTTKIVKKIYANDYLLIASKKINSGILINGSIHLTDKPDRYIIYGVWQNKSNTVEKEKQYLTGFYKWTTDFNLDDKPGDTILNKVVSSAINLNVSYIKAEKGKDIFALHEYKTDTSDYDARETGYGSSSWQNELMASVDLSSAPHFSQADLLELASLNHYGGSSFSPPNEIVVRRSAISTSERAVNIFSLSNSNQLYWQKNFDSSNIELLQPLDNKKIVAGKKAIHIIYLRQLTSKKTGISQVIVSYADGTYKNDNVRIWNSTYTYSLNQAMDVGDNSIIIPCFKSKKIVFAKLIFE